MYGLGKDAVTIYLHIKEITSSGPLISEWLKAPRLSESQGNYLSKLPPILKQAEPLDLGPEDFGLFWDFSTYSNDQAGLDKENKILIDPNYHFNDEADQIAALQYTISPEEGRRTIWEISRVKYSEFLTRWMGVESAYLYLTGPTIETVLLPPVNRNAIHIICNSIVKNTILLQKIRPDVLMFSDPAYHLGISKYATSFRAYVKQTMANFPNMICMVPERYYLLTVAFLGPKQRANCWHSARANGKFSFSIC